MDCLIKRRLSEFLTEDICEKAGLAERLTVPKSGSENDPFITSLEYDSRKVQPGALYFALPGSHTDGHKFIGDAVKNGAAAVVYEKEPVKKTKGVVYLKVKDSRFSMSPISASYYGFPSHRLLVAGVTGTEGKSTTVYLIWQLLGLLGKKTGFISTVQFSDGGEAQWNPEHQTTPEAPIVQRMLWQMAENGCSCAVVEASSHGLSFKTNRLGDVEFDAAVFTNVAHEHLEFHGTWEKYRDDKANLFRALDHRQTKANISGAGFIPEPFGVVNIDDKSAGYFSSATNQKKLSFSVKGRNADLTMNSIESGAYGSWYNVFIVAEYLRIDIRDRLPGAFNAGNVMAALLVTSGMTGIPVWEIIPLCPRLVPVRGRMTNINRGQPFEVLVDYAHTPSSYETIFPPFRDKFSKTGGRIISLFGSAGERDITKRAEQGKIAAAYSDYIVLTDEDPRGEQPMAILEEIAKGIHNRGVNDKAAKNQNAAAEKKVVFTKDKNLFLIPDRPTAIRKALSLAREGDLVLLLGKSHENSIIYKNREMPYDEISETEKALDDLKNEK